MEVLNSPIRTPNVHRVERWISAVGGGLLAIDGLRRGKRGLLQVAAGALLLRRGFSGKCELYRALGLRSAPNGSAIPYEVGVRAHASIKIDQPREQVYAYWRRLENLPRFMRHVVSVETIDDNRSHWIAEGLGGKRYEWSAEIINEIPDELLAWKSLPDSDFDSAGSVRFRDVAGGGTEIRIELQYNPPAGALGAYVARIFQREPEQELARDLRRLKRILEEESSAFQGGAAPDLLADI